MILLVIVAVVVLITAVSKELTDYADDTRGSD